MTKEQEAIAKILRLDGKSISEVAAHLKVQEKDVEPVFYRKKYTKSLIGFETTKYFRLDQWMKERGMTRVMFADKSGVNYSTLCKIMSDSVDISKSHIDKILKFTGLTYEEAFGKEGDIYD